MSLGDGVSDDSTITTKIAAASVPRVVELFVDLLAARHQKLFAVIDQRAEAAGVDLELRETTLVIFGNPTAGTKVMDAAPLSALDLPLKVLVWSDGTVTKVSYLAPQELANRHHLTDELAGLLSGIDGLTDALILAAQTEASP